MKGKLIVLDGTDGSGKTTQTELLVERLKKERHSVEVISFPQYGDKCAGLVEDYLAGRFGTAKEVGPYRAAIFYAGDRYAASSKIRKWLSEGKVVIANRYVFSSMGHQAGKISDLSKRDGFLAWLKDLEYNIFGIPKEDLNILLYVPFEIGMELAKKRAKGNKQDIHEVDVGHMKEASESYLYVAKKFKWPVIECAPSGSILPKEEIAEMVWKKVKKAL